MIEQNLAAIGTDPELRVAFVAYCRSVERRLARLDYNVREEITGALVDALYTQIDSVPIRLRSGLRFELPYRSKIARDLVLRDSEVPDHVFEPQTTRLLLHLARNAQTVLIGGAYAGDHAVLLAAAIAAAGGVIHAFEPNSELMRALKKNADLNALANIRYLGEGLWERDGASLRLVGEDAWARMEEVGAGDPAAIRCTTIDAYGKASKLASIDMIMLDIEGSELAALRGAASYLSQPLGQAPDIIYEVNRGYVDWSQGLAQTPIVSMLAEFGYTSYCVRDYQSNVEMADPTIELVPVDDVYLAGPPHGFNMLAVKDTAKVLDDSHFRLTPGLSPKLLFHRDPRLHAPSMQQVARV